MHDQFTFDKLRYLMQLPWAEILSVLSVLVILVIKPLRNTAVRVVSLLVNLIPSLVLLLLGLLAIPFWSPARWLAQKILQYVPLDRFCFALLPLSRFLSSDPLCRGQKEAVARSMWPQKQFPFLYTDNIPGDIVRPLYEDGRLLGGHAITWAADRHVTDRVIPASLLPGLTASILSFFVILVPAMLWTLSVIRFVQRYWQRIPTVVLEKFPGMNPVSVPQDWIMDAKSQVLAVYYQSIARLFGQNLVFTVCLLLGLFIVVAIMALNLIKKRINAPYEFTTKDAVVRWPFRAEFRQNLLYTYGRQVEHATTFLKDTPVFRLGKATGTLRARGDLTAPTSDQDMCLDAESLFQHLMVFGGTGEGKTTAILKPLMQQVLSIRKFGLFVCDAKGILWQDALKAAQQVQRQDDVLIIGTGEGQYGVNILNGLTPTQIAAVLRSVLIQLGGESSDTFWPDMAATVMRHVLTIARSYTLTTQYKKDSQQADPYSLWWVYQAVLDDTIVRGTVQAITTDAKALNALIMDKDATAEQVDRLEVEKLRLLPDDAIASIDYMQSAWSSMAKDTKSGIIATITHLLDGFSGTEVLRQRFAMGRNDQTIDLEIALQGKIVLNALSNIEDGLPARLVSIFVKTLLYRAARIREARFASLTPPQRPQDQPCLVVIDEAHELVTADTESGLSDATFWNIARSTGIAGVFATQTMAAFKQALGAEATDNFLQQARSKIFLRSEDEETVEYACWCAGTFERDRTYDDHQRESLEFRNLLDNWEPFQSHIDIDAVCNTRMLYLHAARQLIWSSFRYVTPAEAQQSYSPDTRFLPTSAAFLSNQQHHIAYMSSLQQSAWRAEDLEHKYRSEGNEIRQALSPVDIIAMGRWLCFSHIQRAGLVRQDIMTLEHDFN